MFYRPHPHKLLGENCRRGIYTKQINYQEGTDLIFDRLGIQCVKRRDVKKELEERSLMNVHPAGRDFENDHLSQRQPIDLNSLRLCFQVFIIPDNSNDFRFIAPIVSDIINDKKSSSGLNITELSRESCSVAGRKKMILLCDKVYCVYSCGCWRLRHISF